MKQSTKNLVEKKLALVEKALSDIRVALEKEEKLPMFLTDYDTYLVPRRVEFCEHCGDIRSQMGYADVNIEDYAKDKNCSPNITWCRTCGEQSGAKPFNPRSRTPGGRMVSQAAL